MTSVLAIAGSLRTASMNRGLVRAAAAAAPAGMTVEPFDLRGVPLYDGDVEAAGDPPRVRELKAALARHDGLLIATAEYNWSLSGVLKNALDWASRRPERALDDVPVALCGASPGGFGTARGQLALRQTLQATRNPVLPGPGVFVSRAEALFDAEGNLADDATAAALRGLLEAFASWIAHMKA